MMARLGWVGTGVMGRSMCEHLLKAGHKVTVFNRTPAKLQTLVDIGANPASTVKEVAENSDIVFTIVGFPSDVNEVMLSSDGLIANMKEGGIIVDMTTSEPSLAKSLAESAILRNISVLDAPVSGGDVGARNATLSIMVGGNENAFNTVLPYFNIMGKNIRRMGEAGCGQHTKMVI
jgi:3-hydroxyisobutyrate dehydrogenase